MRLIKIKDMSIPGAILLTGLIVGLSVFLTTWIFFGGDNNRQKLSTPTPASMNRNAQQNGANNLTPQQIQMIQQQRAAQVSQQASSTPPAPVIKPATVVTPPTKTIKK
ncbi:MAG: hypothetical protein WCJ74_03840 [bacterium]